MSRSPEGPRVTVILTSLRLPFISASVLPFIAGSLLARPIFSWHLFLLGLLTVIGSHVGANLLNDVGDSQSGLDWQDKNAYGFFGGSKLIQQGILSERFYVCAAISCFIVAGISVGRIVALRHSPLPLAALLAVIFMASQYSLPPLRLSYRFLGEPVIFLLFGPVTVMGAYYIQTGIFPDGRAFLLSIPFGLLVLTVLFANEIPDYEVDRAGGKQTWVAMTGNDFAYLIYGMLIIMSLAAVVLNIMAGVLSMRAFFAGIILLPAVGATAILQRRYRDKWRCILASRLTIMAFTLASVILIVDLII